MKKFLYIFLLLVLMCSLCACSRGSKDSTFLDNFYICRINTIPCKVDVHTGIVTALCQDPLCTHDENSECPFLGYSAGSVYEGTLYYITEDNIPTDDLYKPGVLYSYDFETSAVKKIAELPSFAGLSGSGSMNFRGGYYSRDFSSADGSYESHYRINLTNGEIEYFDNSVPDDVPFAYYNRKPIYISMKEDGLHAEIRLGDDVIYKGELAIAFTDQIVNDSLLYAVYYRDENGKPDFDRQTLYSLNLKTGESSIVSEEFSDVYFALYGNCIYYSRYVDNPPIIGYDLNQKKDVYNKTAGKLFCLNLKTGVETEVLSLPEYRLTYMIETVGDRILLAYENTDYESYTEDNSGRGVWYDYEKTSGWIIYNPETGEWMDVKAELDGVGGHILELY